VPKTPKTTHAGRLIINSDIFWTILGKEILAKKLLRANQLELCKSFHVCEKDKKLIAPNFCERKISLIKNTTAIPKNHVPIIRNKNFIFQRLEFYLAKD